MPDTQLLKRSSWSRSGLLRVLLLNLLPLVHMVCPQVRYECYGKCNAIAEFYLRVGSILTICVSLWPGLNREYMFALLLQRFFVIAWISRVVAERSIFAAEVADFGVGLLVQLRMCAITRVEEITYTWISWRCLLVCNSCILFTCHFYDMSLARQIVDLSFI